MGYPRVLTRLLNTPLAISQCKLDILSSNITLKILAGEKIESLVNNDSVISNRDTTVASSNTSVIRVFDSLVSKNGGGDSGSTSYESITRQVISSIEAGATKLVFYIDSPGGEVSGLFGLAEFIAELPSKHGIETIAVTDGMATSAAYVLASAAQKVYATTSSIIGSMGVIMTLVDATAADTKAGLTYTIIRSKSEKAIGNPHEGITAEGLADKVKMLGTLDTIMNETINKFRPLLSIESILNLKGNTVLGEEALALNLIDGIISSVNDILIPVTKKDILTTVSSTQQKGFNMNVEDLQAEVIKLGAELTKAKAEMGLAEAKAKMSEQGRILGIIEASTTFGTPLTAAVNFIKLGANVDMAVSAFETIKEHSQIASHVDVAVSAITSTVSASDFPSSAKSAMQTLLDMKAAGVANPSKGLL